MQRKFLYLLIGIFALNIRLFLNFSFDLIPGVNGGYYPLQVRAILENGRLAFSDMPLLFYLNVLLLKLLSFVGFAVTDKLIIVVVKIVDCLSLPLILIPLYSIIRKINRDIPLLLETSIALYATLSFAPLILTSDLQKNALALPFMLSAFLFFYQSVQSKSVKNIAFFLVFSLLVALTHFGAFAFLGFIIVLWLIFHFKHKALFPILTLILLGLGANAIFDLPRFFRIIMFWNSIFEHPFIASQQVSPFDVLSILLSIVIATYGIWIYRKVDISDKAGLLAFAVALVTFSFPLLDIEYFRRFSLMLFIPQLLVVLFISRNFKLKVSRSLGVILVFLVLLSVISVVGKKKKPMIGCSTYPELQEIASKIEGKREKTIVIARHGLEWWTAWVCRTKVAQEKAINNEFYNNYQNVLILVQKKRNNQFQSRELTPFEEPKVIASDKLVYSTPSFDLYKRL